MVETIVTLTPMSCPGTVLSSFQAIKFVLCLHGTYVFHAIELACGLGVGASEAGMGTDHSQVPGLDVGLGQGQPARCVC